MRVVRIAGLRSALAVVFFAALVGVAFLGFGTSQAATVTVTQLGPPEFKFSPSTVTLDQGDTLQVVNGSSDTSHTFTISSEGIDIVNAPGQTQSIVIGLTPGTYPFICSFHFPLGMKGTLIVNPAPSPTPTPTPSPTG